MYKFLPALFTCGLCLLLACPAWSQTDDSVLNRVMHSWDRYADRHQSPGLFLHLDKSVYEHTEHIQFTAWLLGGVRDTTHLHAFYVLLVDPATRKMAAFDRFALSRYAGTGTLYLADTLKPGKYLVVAYTDDRLQGLDQPLFRQEITLLPDLPVPFNLVRQPDTTQLKFRVTTDYGGLGAGAGFRYRLQADGHTIDSGEKKVDAFGEVALPAPAGSGAAAASPAAAGSRTPAPATGQLMLSAVIRRQDQTAWFWLPVAMSPVEWRVHYYPEGGDLVADHPCQLGVEIRDAIGAGVCTQGRLLEDGHPVTAFHTDDNGWGRLEGAFHSGHTYAVDFPDGPPGLRVRDSLPAILPEGYSLLVRDGVARDSVAVQFYFPAPGLKCRLLVYNEREIVYASTLTTRYTSARMSIPVKDWPSGLLTMTLFDPQGSPVAERRLYSPAPAVSVTIRPDSAVYQTRSRIRLSIRTTDAKGQGIASLFSLSTVLSSRLQPDLAPDIRRYDALDRHLSAGPPPRAPDPFPRSDPGYGLSYGRWEDDSVINLLLLTRGWTRYHWQELAADSLQPAGSGLSLAGSGLSAASSGLSPMAAGPAEDYGFVTYRGKKPVAPITMLVLGSSMSTFDTDSAGRFRIPSGALLSDRNSDLALSLSGGDRQDEYRIVLFNRYDSLNRSLAGLWYFPLPPEKAAREKAPPEENKEAQPFAHARTLQKVIVTRDHNGSDNGCRDYVCMMGILNCKNHSFGRKPIIGETVLTAVGYNEFRQVVYRGCEMTEPVYPPFLRRIKPICLLRDTYQNDTTPIPPSATALYTTLHWAPLVLTDASGNAEISFYANDLPGLYDNILQGISRQGVLSGRQSFRIVRNKE